jgi:hypothetical protein
MTAASTMGASTPLEVPQDHSSEKIAPAIGALKIAPMPAGAPQPASVRKLSRAGLEKLADLRGDRRRSDDGPRAHRSRTQGQRGVV